MSSTFSTNLAIELIGTGDQAGTWGNTTNTNLGTLIEQAISGYVTQAMTTGNTTSITIPDGASGVARNMYLELTGTGGASTVLAVPSNKKLYFVFNNTTGAVTVKVGAGTGVSVSAAEKKILVSNGTDIVEATSYLTAVGNSLNLTTLTATSANITTLTGTNWSATSLTLTNALKVAEGGTGLDSTPTNGQLLIGNGTGFALSTLTAGTGIAVTNNAGSITIATSGGGLPAVVVTASTAITAAANFHYVLTAGTTATVTLPASPTISDTIYVTVGNGLVTNVVARNGKNIQGLAEDLTLNSAYASAQLRFTSDATEGWVLA